MELDHEVVGKVQDKVDLVEDVAKEQDPVANVFAHHAEQAHLIKEACHVSKRHALNVVQV
jgi:hypothetical protein